MRLKIPALRSPTSIAFSRTVISSWNSGVCSGGTSDCEAGRLSSSTVNLENTAVISRNATSATMRFMNAVMLSSVSPIRRLRCPRTCFMFAPSVGPRACSAGALRRVRTFSRALGDRVQELHRAHLEAVDDLGRLGLQQHVDEEQRNSNDQA